MKVLNLSNSRTRLSLGRATSKDINTIHLLTGPNGSGKTEALAFLAAAFVGSGPRRSFHLEWSIGTDTYRASETWQVYDKPARVVTQTFSPFTRFPAPQADDINQPISLTDVYSDGVQRGQYHQAIGFHRGMRLSGGFLARRTLENAIFRLSEGIEPSSAIFNVLFRLGFRPHFRLEYNHAPLLSRILDSGSRTGIASYFSEIESSKERKPDALAKEIKLAGSRRFSELFETAAFQSGVSRDADRSITLDFSIDGERSQFSRLQSIAFLRRLNLLTLRRFSLLGDSRDEIEIAQTSSGQQQLICSIMGLATAIQDNSLVLIDEPELSLHPQWQQEYLDYLLACMSGFRSCHALVATHSPLIVQQGQRHGIEIVRVGDDHEPRFESKNPGSVESTLIDVFETGTPESSFVANEILSAINTAEEGGREAAQESLRELNQLREVYTKSRSPDVKSLSLIDDALRLLETSSNE